MKVYIQKNVLDDVSLSRLQEACPFLTITLHPEPDIEAAFVWPNFAVEERLKNHPKLRWIQLLSAGYDKADLKAVYRRGIILSNARHVNSIPIAEDIVARILYFNRDMAIYTNDKENMVWEPRQNAHEIYHSTVGILGAGSIASLTAERLKAFSARVICYRETALNSPHFDETFVGEEGLKDLLNQSDYVIVCLPLNEKTKYLLNHQTLGYMTKNALLINIARGDIIDENALVDVLERQAIRGASLDVFHEEPLPKTSRLWTLNNVYLTPHIAFSSSVFLSRLTDLLVENTERFFAEEPLLNPIK